MNVQLPDVYGSVEAFLSRTGVDAWYQLSLNKEQLRDQCDALEESQKQGTNVEPVEARVQSFTSVVLGFAESAEALVKKAQKDQKKLIQACKASQLKRGETRRPDDPDPVVTGAVATITTTIEACMTFLVLFGGGAPIGEAVGFGLLFAGIGTALAHILGYHGLRRINYRFLPELDAQSDIPWKRRRMGRRIAAVCLGLILLLVFSAARLRATGSLDDTFDFSDVGILATFDDGMAIALIAMAVVTTCLNTWQGITGWNDRAYGYEVPFRELDDHEEKVLEQADGLHDQVENASVRVVDILLERQELLQDYVANPSETAARLVEDVRRHNVEVRAALKDELRFQQIQNAVRETEEALPSSTTDIEHAFAALFISERELADSDGSSTAQAEAASDFLDELIARVEAAEAEAHAKIDIASSQFLAEGAVLGSQVLN